MPPTGSKQYLQKYVKGWESESDFKGWLKPCIGDGTKAHCAYCKIDLLAHRKSLKDHANTKKHLQNIRIEKECRRIPTITQYVKSTIDEKRKIAELKIAAFVCEHCSVNSIDHLGQVIKDLDPNSQVLSKIKLHRTKCTGLIVNVLSPCFFQELVADLGNSYYSLIIDESTMVDTKKVMCIMIRYFSKKMQKIHTTFYRLIELESGTAESMTNAFKKQIADDGLKLEKLIGIGVDGANSMVGERNSVGSRLKEIVPHLVVVKCLCHSLHLAAERSCDILPRNLDYLVKESHAWFSKSTKRNIEYNKLFQIISQSAPKKIAKLSGTRWLARMEAITTIIDQWDELKLHFELARTTDRCSAGYIAEELYNMYKSKENKLYLVFLRDALKDVLNLNKMFQSNAVEPLKLFQDLNNLMFSTLQRIVVPNQLEKVTNQDLSDYKFQNYIMPLDCINFGYHFNELACNIDPESLKVIKNRCKDFLIRLTEGLQSRVPKNIEILQKLSYFSPEYAKNQSKIDITEIALAFKIVCGDIDATVREWNFLHRLEIEATTSDEFWSKVYKEVDAAGEKRFEHISELALALLSLPFSNAAVERAFSIINIIKDKLRNKLMIETVDAILRVRFSMINTCTQFQPSSDMLKKFTSEVVYGGEFNDHALDVIDHYDTVDKLPNLS